MSSDAGWEAEVQKAVSTIQSRNPDDIEQAVDLYLAGYQAVCESVAGQALFAKHAIDTRMAAMRQDILNALAPSITEQDIRTVMERYGESLLDLDAEYSNEFLAWFKGKDSVMFEEWRMSNMAHEQDQEELAKELLFDFSNSALGGRVYESHDALLVEFCTTCSNARRHIRGLLDKLNED